MKVYTPFIRSRKADKVITQVDEKALRIKAKEQSQPTRKKECDETIQPGATLTDMFQSNFDAAVKMT